MLADEHAPLPAAQLASRRRGHVADGAGSHHSPSPRIAAATTSAAAFGASITAGKPWGRSYPRELRRALNAKFPQANFTLHNFGYPGASLDFLSACRERMLPVHADLYLLEATDNYLHGALAFEAAGRQLEGVLLALLRRRAAGTSAVLVSPFAQSCARRLVHLKPYAHLPRDAATTRESLAACYSNETFPGLVEALARHHRLPAASVRLAVRAALHANSSEAALRAFTEEDFVHPNADGERQIAELIVAALWRAAGCTDDDRLFPGYCSDDDVAGDVRRRDAHHLAARVPPPTECAALPPAVPPMFSRSASDDTGDAASATCAFGDELRAHVLEARGWSYVVEMSGQGQPKPGYIATAPGSSIDMCFRRSGGGKSASAAWWQLGYLRSYEGMGMARGECVAGCKCASRTWDAHQTRRVSQVAVSKLRIDRWLRPTEAAAAACPCVIRLTLLNESSSGGHKFKLAALFSGFRMYNPSYATCGRAKCSTANDGIGTSARQSVATASKQALSAYAAPVGERRKGG